MSNFYTKILLLIVGAFPIGSSANEATANLNQVMVNSLIGVLEGLTPIFLILIIISVLAPVAKKKPEYLAIGCGWIFLAILVVILVAFLIAFIEAHRNFFICLGAVLFVLVICFCFYAYFGESADNDDGENQNNVKTLKNENLKESISSFPKYVQTEQNFQNQVELEKAGKRGEKDMCSAILNASRADKRYYKLLSDLYIPKDGGRRTTQIDALLLHESGIYCFECKNLSGKITGSKGTDKWEQVKLSGEKKFFFNPIIQNDGHLNDLKCFLKIGKDDFRSYSCIVFGVHSILASTPGDFANVSFHYINTLRNELTADLRNRKTVYSKSEIDQWMKKLFSCVNVSENVRLSHKRDVQRRFS